MSTIEQKEKNLNQLISKLNSLTLTYSQPTYEVEKIKTEKNEILRQKIEIEKKNQELLREHKYLKEKICREIIRERKGTSRELRNISDIIYQRQSTTKDELINMIEIIISRLLNVEIRNKEHRKVVEEKGYELIVLMNVIVKKK